MSGLQVGYSRIGATAEPAGHAVLHLGKDFDLIAGITGQLVERLSM
ncbi:hypothetical protein [Gordonia sp. SL306]|nr:hypothetical protein [Gordonia sp. SL306]WAC57561.1 hypothetical protein OVA31_10170 [Gordonia sp. SL306]